MKKIYLLILLIFTICVPTFAQHKKGKNHDEMRKEYQEYKMKVLAQEMDLKDDQQKKFFELYKKESDERHVLHHQLRDLNKKVKDGKNVSEKEYDKLNKMIAETKEKDAAIEKKYDSEYSKFLSSKQIFKMKEVEEMFRAKLREMRSKKGK